MRNDRDRLLAVAGTDDYRVLIATAKGLKSTTKWLIKQNMLSQYMLAAETLHLD